MTPSLNVGDQIWYHVYGKTVQHHAIYVGNGEVIHLDDKDTDKDYGHCSTCIELLKRRPDGYVRKSCLTCWRSGDANIKYYTCEYNKSLGSLIVRETGSRSMKRSHRGDLVAARARWYFENDSFGRWELFAHNCEDFCRFCKILKLGSKQSTRGLLIISVPTGIGGTVLSITALKALRTLWREKLLLELPQNLRYEYL